MCIVNNPRIPKFTPSMKFPTRRKKLPWNWEYFDVSTPINHREYNLTLSTSKSKLEKREREIV